VNALEFLARGGYAARGVVYLIVGGFAVGAILYGSETKTPDEAASVLLDQPFGKVLVGLLVIGLFGYAAWRIVQALLDTDGHGRNAKGIVIRGALLASAVVYGGLALSAAAILGFGSGGDGSGGQQDLLDRVIEILGSTWTAALLALVFLAAAAAHAFRAFRATFLRYFRVDAGKRRIVKAVGRAGLLARGAVFLVLAGLMGYRAATASRADATPPDLEQVMAAIAGLPAGPWLLGALGLGLLAFAVYSFTAALYRTIDFRPLASAARRGTEAVADLSGNMAGRPANAMRTADRT
jgi:hypothetical protein